MYPWLYGILKQDKREKRNKQEKQNKREKHDKKEYERAMERQKALTTYDIAHYCDVTPRTVAQWIHEGKISAFKTPGNHNRVLEADFIAFLKKYNIPLPNEESFKTKKKRILFVDDDRGMILALQRIFRGNPDYETDVALDGFEAGKKFARFKPHLIILDIHMPKIDGFEVCSQIRSDPINMNVKIIVMSGIIDKEEIDRIMELGADQFLEKPFDVKKLKDHIQQLLVEERDSRRSVS